jgi:hypothetical protein
MSRRIVGNRMDTACLARATQLAKADVEEEFRIEESALTTKQQLSTRSE